MLHLGPESPDPALETCLRCGAPAVPRLVEPIRPGLSPLCRACLEELDPDEARRQRRVEEVARTLFGEP